MEYDSSHIAAWNRFFAFRIVVLGLQVAQDEYQGQSGQTLYAKILEHKYFIDTSYRIRHRLELKYFHVAVSHNFCSMLIKQLIDIEK